MSVYTTEVRFICEYEAELTESSGYNDIDNVIEKSWNKIFKKFPIFDETYRETLCKKILMHYYTREISAETVGLWKLWLNTKMNEIMPYYNQLYVSAQRKFDPFNEIDFTREITENSSQNKTGTDNTIGSVNSTNDLTGKSSQTSNDSASRETTSNETQSQSTNTQTTSNEKRLHSDTPQGSINNITENGYLTDAVLTDNVSDTNASADITKKISGTNTETTTANISSENSNNSKNTTESTNKNNYDESANGAKKILEKYQGKNSSVSYSKLINEYRETFLNIDLDIILSLSDLFMNIY